MGENKKPKKKKRAKATLPSGKVVLFLHVKKDTKAWFQKVTHGRSAKENKRITQSTVAERILRNLKQSPRLLKEALR